MSDAVRTEVRDRVNRFKDHPGLLGWYMADEPEINNVTAGAIDDERADYIKVANIEPLSTPDHYKLDLILRADTDFSREAAGPE